MERMYFLDKDGREHRLEVLRALARSIAAEIDGLLGTTRISSSESVDQDPINLEDEVRKFECDLIRFALFKVGGHQSRAAKLLGVKASTLHEKIKRHRISAVGFAQPEADTRGIQTAEWDDTTPSRTAP